VYAYMMHIYCTYMYAYGVSTISRLLKIIGLFCRISSLLYGSFAKETCNFKELTNRSHPICIYDAHIMQVYICIHLQWMTCIYAYTYDALYPLILHNMCITYICIYVCIKYQNTHAHIQIYIHSQLQTQLPSVYICIYIYIIHMYA